MKILSTENVFVGGYRLEQEGGKFVKGKEYNIKKEERILKSFSFVFNGKTLDIINSQNYDYSKIAADINTRHLYYSGVRSLNTKGIYETDNGTITMLMEESLQVAYRQDGRITDVETVCKNIFIDSYTTDGAPVQSSILYKYQQNDAVDRLPLSSMPLSFDVLNLGNKLVLIFNDDINNLQNNKCREKPVKMKNKSKVVATVCTIENGLIGNKTVFINSKKENRFYISLIKQFDNEALVYTQSQKVNSGPLMLEKITW
jgi:hypothetical protein